ncbi:NAD-dependent epimerase/dehydratase family protein [Micromonospora echinospora]|uniref:NAD-dependent epimerase/dehydratase family protein n=1 Tax=Micromonospora echinospora TaxID=1877 RepID=UPI00379EB118
MRILVLGGTSFVGRAIVADALARGHAVTTLNRGRTGPDIPGVEAVRGDRSHDGGLGALHGRSFDAAVDPSGLVPADVLRTARLLAPRTGFYAFVSSVSVYPDWKSVPVREDSPCHAGEPDEEGDPADHRRYGPRKVGCEQAVRLVYPADRTLVVRPGTIVGPHDNIGQALWWLDRIARGGPVLAPGDPSRPLQLLDVRDLARFVVERVENWASGIFNTVPDGPNTTMGAWLDHAVTATGSAAELVWAPEELLLAREVLPWWEMPLWLPDVPGNRAAWDTSGAAAAAAGLTCRPVGETVTDTWRWMASGGRPAPMPGLPPVGMGGFRERRLLQTVLAGR